MKRGRNLLWTSLTLLIATSLVLSVFFSSQLLSIHPVHGHPASTKVYVDPPSIVPPDAPTPEEGGKITLRPDGDGTYNNWTGSYADWDDADTHDGDDTYVSVTAKDLFQSSTLEDHTTETWEIASVTVVIFARPNVTARGDLVAPTLVIEGEEHVGEEKLTGLTNKTYTIWTNEWGKNPATDDFWTWAEIDQLEAGVKSKLIQGGKWAGEMRVTQLYVEVSGPRFTVDVNVEDVTDLSIYQFEMFYNPDIIEGVWVNPKDAVEVGPFLGSAGGYVTQTPGIWNNTRGWLSITGAYLAETDPAKSPDGDGTLSTVIFRVVRKGETELRLGKKTGLMDPEGDWIIYGENLEDGYFRNVAVELIPTADFVYTPDIPLAHVPRVPIEGYNVTFDATTSQRGAADEAITTYKWFFRRAVGELTPGLEIFTGTDPLISYNYTTRSTPTLIYTVTLTIIDADDVVGTTPPLEVPVYAHDIHFKDITTSAPIGVLPPAVPYVDIGEVLEVTLVAENQGAFTESFDVSCFWSATYEGEMHLGSIDQSIEYPTRVTGLGAGATKNLTFYWDTTGCGGVPHAGRYRLHANATAVPYEFDKERDPTKLADNERTASGPRIRFHDMALSKLTPSEKAVTPGEIVQVELTVTNHGDFNETNVVVRTWAEKQGESPIDIGTTTIPLMTNKSFSDKYLKMTPPYRDNYTTTLTFDWDTSAVPAGTYTISAEASVVPVEYNITNNVINRAAPEWAEYAVNWDGVAGDDFNIAVLEDMTSVETVSNTGGSEEGMEVSLDISGPSGETRYCYVKVPKDALKGYPCLVLLDGADVTLEESTFTRQSTTDMFFYLTCTFSSTSTVQIFGPNSYPVDYPVGGPVEHSVGIASDSAVSGFGFSPSVGSGDITFDLAGGGYCAVGVPPELLEPDYTVSLDGSPGVFTMKSNLTHNFLYIHGSSLNVVVSGMIPAADTTSPAVSIVSPENKTYSVDYVLLNFTVDEATSWVGYSLNGQANVTLSGDPILYFLPDGVHNIVVYAKDAADNTGAGTVHFTVDTTAPTITDVSQIPLANNVLPEDTVKVNATVTDDVTGVKAVALNYTSDDGTWSSVDMTNPVGDVWSATIPAFPYCTNVTYMVIAEDNGGNTITTEEMGYDYGYHVIPEFPTWTSMLLIVVVLTVAVAIYKRRLLKRPLR